MYLVFSNLRAMNIHDKFLAMSIYLVLSHSSSFFLILVIYFFTWICFKKMLFQLFFSQFKTVYFLCARFLIDLDTTFSEPPRLLKLFLRRLSRPDMVDPTRPELFPRDLPGDNPRTTSSLNAAKNPCFFSISLLHQQEFLCYKYILRFVCRCVCICGIVLLKQRGDLQSC